MAFSFDPGRQSPLVAIASFDYTDLTSGSAFTIIKLPYNSVVVGGQIIVDTAWNSATSDVAEVGDTGDTDRYYASASIAATGANDLLTTGYINTGGLDIDIIWTGTGAAPTAGAARVIVHYVITDRATEAQTT